MKHLKHMRIWLDILMFAAFVAALGMRITDVFLHEILGTAALILFAVHNILNWRWYKNLFAGKYFAMRILGAATNIGLLILCIIVFASAVIISQYIFGFGISDMQARQWHSVAAYYLMLFLGLHMGLHFNFIFGKAGAFAKCAMAAFALLGIYAVFDRAFLQKLFCGYSFDYWSGELPAVLFFAENAAIVFLTAAITRGLIYIFNSKTKGLK